MLAKLARLFVMTTLLIAFIGQGFANAYAQPCSPSEHTSAEANAATMSFSEVELDTENASAEEDECCELDCCDNNCNCLGSSCSAVAYLVSAVTTFTTFSPFATAYFSHIQYPVSNHNYLYRPPIHA